MAKRQKNSGKNVKNSSYGDVPVIVRKNNGDVSAKIGGKNDKFLKR